MFGLLLKLSSLIIHYICHSLHLSRICLATRQQPSPRPLLGGGFTETPYCWVKAERHHGIDLGQTAKRARPVLPWAYSSNAD
jgi:hypothetical protein